jgi:16S rRNA (guanine527-N7)-methyltransferase
MTETPERVDDDDERGGAPDDRVHTALVRVLTEIQRRGGIGRGPVDASIEHAEAFVAALPHLRSPSTCRLVDLGSGGGLPGLVIIARRPELQVTLVERRAKRADLLRYGVRALGAVDRVDVVAEDVQRLIDVRAGSFDVVTARSFAGPERVLEVAGALLARPGWLLVAEPPTPRDWPADGHDLVDDGRIGPIRRFRHPET